MGLFSSLSLYMYIICHIQYFIGAVLRHTYPPAFVVPHLPSAAGPCSGLWPMKELFMHHGEKWHYWVLLEWCRFSFLLVIWATGGFCHQVQVKLTCLSASTVRKFVPAEANIDCDKAKVNVCWGGWQIPHAERWNQKHKERFPLHPCVSV